jgi:DNA helicase-2/ATP-dependent DNA helicase PcrA
MEPIEGLNPEQRAAVTLPDEPALILAGAGSGKTRVLTTRIAWLVRNGRAHPAGVLAVTFTNKAAREMLVRIDGMLSLPPRGMWIGTFHGLSNRLLRAHWKDAGLPQAFQILDAQDQLSAIKRLLRVANVSEERCAPRELQMFISGGKEAGLRAADMGGRGGDRLWIELFAAYDAQCQKEGSVDFAELLLRSVELLTRNEAVREHYRRRFSHILVDEFQDTNPLQYRWLKLFAGRSAPIFAVGDDDQSIYRFRGANVGNMSDFQREFDVKHLVRLEQNYRSHGNILDAANHLIGNNARRLGKRLWTDQGPGEKIQLFDAPTDGLEAAWVVEEVRRLRSGGSRLSEIAILYRSNAQSRIIEHGLFNAALPYRVYGGLRFFERAEVKHALAYLRLAANPDDDVSFARVVNFPPRGIGARTIELLQQAAQRQGGSLHGAIGGFEGRSGASLQAFAALIAGLREAASRMELSELVGWAVEKSGLAQHYRGEKDGSERVENLGELVTAASGFRHEQADGAGELPPGVEPLAEADFPPGPEGTLAAFLAHAALEAGDNQAGAGEDALQLMTVHAAKGLEFDQVFVTGLEEGLFPHENSLSEADGLEEERRLMYVAITRARKLLSLSFAQSRMLHGQTRYGLRSRFVDELPAECLHMPAHRPRAPEPGAWGANHGGFGGAGGGGAARAPSGEAGAGGPGLRVGQNVRHARFGDGVVVRLQGSGTDARAQIQFGSWGVKELLLAVARLQPVP